MADSSPVNLVAALEATVHRVLEALAEELAALGLTHAEVNALFHLGGDEPQTVASLLRLTGQRASTLTGVLNRLEGRSLVVRTVNPRDRRSFVLELTEGGAAAAAEVRRAFAALEDAALRDRSARARSSFLAVLAGLDEASRQAGQKTGVSV